MKRIGLMIRTGMLCTITTLLAGCGGQTQDGPPSAAQTPQVAKVDRIDGRVQPASADQDVRRIQSGSAAVPPASQVRLGALVQEKAKPADAGVGPRMVGRVRAVNTTQAGGQTMQQLRWQPAAGGGQVAAISFSAEGAHGLRLGVVVRQLPGSAVLRVYRQAKPDTVFRISGQEVLQRTERNALAGAAGIDGQTWWTPDLGAEEATLEVELPAGTATGAVDIAVPRVSHIFENLSIPTEDELQTQINESLPCQRDASCSDDYADQRNAVARMSFVVDGDSFLCTGTLLNDAHNSGTPYFLTANHCISTQAVADTLETAWFYRSPVCRNRTLSDNTVTRWGGAQLLYASGNTDSTLLRLNDTPPAGAFFAGWDASAQKMFSSVTGLHHPRGDLLKISQGSLRGQTSCTSTGSNTFACTGSTGNYYEVRWNRGTTESGSSGSALFNRANQVIGNLYGGNSSCFAIASSNEYYGRFDIAYETALKQWLAAPESTWRTAVYRFYNGKTSAHFFTTNVAERDHVIQTLTDFAYEGVTMYAQTQAQSGNIPVYRFYNTVGHSHFYTASAAERDYVKANYPQFSDEGIAWYALPDAATGASAVYRFYHAAKQMHFYTINQAERDFVMAHYPDYTYEGISYYAWTSSQ